MIMILITYELKCLQLARRKHDVNLMNGCWWSRSGGVLWVKNKTNKCRGTPTLGCSFTLTITAVRGQHI